MTSTAPKNEHILKAINGFDESGKEAFLRKYGYQDSRVYQLIYKNRIYPSKAIYGVAYKFTKPEGLPKKSSELNGGKNGAIKI